MTLHSATPQVYASTIYRHFRDMLKPWDQELPVKITDGPTSSTAILPAFMDNIDQIHEVLQYIQSLTPSDVRVSYQYLLIPAYSGNHRHTHTFVFSSRLV
jgi:hypothetical protein